VLVKFRLMNRSIGTNVTVETLLRPETDLERRLLSAPEIQEGMLWGKPRFGHPEGKVVFHVAEVLENIEKLNLNPSDRELLRLIAFVHDSFKYQEESFEHPRKWEQNHAHIARVFMEQYSNDKFTLNLIEYHDSAYFAWRNIFLYQQTEKGFERIEMIKECFKERFQLFYLFFKCDTRTGDKNQAPLKWFEAAFYEIEKVSF